MGNTAQEIRTAFHIGMRFTSAAAMILLFANVYIMGNSQAFLALDSFAYGVAFGLSWWVPLHSQPSKENADE